MRLKETVTWQRVEIAEPEHEQLCVVILAGETMPRVVRYINDPDLGGAFWDDPHRSARDWWNKDAHKFDQWAPAPIAPIAPPVAVAS